MDRQLQPSNELKTFRRYFMICQQHNKSLEQN
jgi:hypothetical protein